MVQLSEIQKTQLPPGGSVHSDGSTSPEIVLSDLNETRRRLLFPDAQAVIDKAIAIFNRRLPAPQPNVNA